MDSFYKILLQDPRILVFVKDEQLNIVYANDAFLELYAPDVRAHVVGIGSTTHFLPTEWRVFTAEDRKALDTGYAELVEEITDYKGCVRILHSRKVRYFDSDGRRLMLGISMDVSELAERERDLAQSNLMLENFAAVAAHDLRSPMSALAASIEVIKTDAGNTLSKRSSMYIDMMDTSLKGLMEQVSTLLRMFKTRQHDKLKDDMCDVGLLLEEVRFNLSSLIDERGARVLCEALPIMRANKTLFRQLMHNLIENSLKHSLQDLSPVIILRYDLVDNMHVFALEDNGSGMSPEVADTLFDLGVHQSASTGMGIGLALCRDVVRMHNGRIWVDAAYKDGCRICFEIPADYTPDKA